ncbi:hypothetical protein VTK73DRAFT_2105 [Phialemonium thermophilum]|uniref:Sialidase domain-containing protein n=1 Tax=Phialemonium thermophilum TaxID=223376 RepID=A0ABR3VSJ2_9PEZI
MSFPVLAHPEAPEVHASTLLLLDQTLLCAWFGGTKEGHGDTKIWLSARDCGAREDGAQAEARWTQPVPVASEEGVPHWNPVLLQSQASGAVFLFYKVGTPISSWHTRVIESTDRGRTWSPPRELVPGDRGGRGPVKNKPIVLSDGTIVAPASLETPDGRWDCFSDVSRDDGKTWTRSEPVPLDRATWPGEGAIQPSLIADGPRTLTMLARSSSGFVARADSTDGGRTWGPMRTTPLFNNNSGIDALRLGDGTWLVVHNPVNQNWGPRTPLVVSASRDAGQTWARIWTLEDKPAPAGFTKILALDTGIVNNGESEFSYPAIVSDHQGGVWISYTGWDPEDFMISDRLGPLGLVISDNRGRRGLR